MGSFGLPRFVVDSLVLVRPVAAKVSGQVFVVFGRQDEGNEWKVTYSLYEMPLKSAVRGMLSVTDLMVQQNLP